jgi:hypothetical protein
MKNTDKYYAILCFYMSDMLILGNNNHMIKSTKKILTNKFDIKNLGVADVILWIQISRIFDGLVLSESYYVEKILDKLSKGDNSTVKTPIDISI